LLGGMWWLGTGRAGPSLKPLAFTLPAATAVPLFALSLQLWAIPAAEVASLLIVPVGLTPLALDFSDRLEGRARRRTQSLVAGLAIASVLAGLGFLVGVEFFMATSWAAVFAAAMVFVPGLAAAGPTFLPSADSVSNSAPAPARFVETTELVIAAATPAVALAALIWKFAGPLWLPLAIWLAAVLLARRFTLRPLMRLATRATFQRDVVVAATEAERARIAADIHDDALQDLTLLVRRLDSAGDKENAEAARAIAARLRAICGDLRLPILDDLGLGPALEWLTERFESMAGGPVYLERLRDEPRLPAEVELALFRIAQEALANAVKHGAPPMVVRYRGGGTWAEMDVDDSGPGVAPGAAELAEKAGHLGLLNMAQRAETVGAELRVGRRPGGGTRVTVVWDASAPATPAAAGGVDADPHQAAAGPGRATAPAPQ
jgi:signal transduction histidine kinase